MKQPTFIGAPFNRFQVTWPGDSHPTLKSSRLASSEELLLLPLFNTITLRSHRRFRAHLLGLSLREGRFPDVASWHLIGRCLLVLMIIIIAPLWRSSLGFGTASDPPCFLLKQWRKTFKCEFSRSFSHESHFLRLTWNVKDVIKQYWTLLFFHFKCVLIISSFILLLLGTRFEKKVTPWMLNGSLCVSSPQEATRSLIN